MINDEDSTIYENPTKPNLQTLLNLVFNVEIAFKTL